MQTSHQPEQLDPPIPVTPHSSLPLDSPLPEVLPLYFSEIETRREGRADQPEYLPEKGSRAMSDESPSRGLVGRAAEMGRVESRDLDTQRRAETGWPAEKDQGERSRTLAGTNNNEADRGYNHLAPLSLPIISPLSNSFDLSEVRKLPDIPQTQRSTSSGWTEEHAPHRDPRQFARQEQDRPSNGVLEPARAFSNPQYPPDREGEHLRYHQTIPSQPIASPSHLLPIASPFSLTSSDQDQDKDDYFKQPTSGFAHPASPGSPGHVQHLTFDDIGPLSPVTGSGMSRTGTTLSSGLSMSGRRLVGPDGKERKGMSRSDSGSRPTKGWERYLPASKWTRIFLLLVLIETIVDIAIQVYLYLRFDRAVNSDFVPDTIKANQRKFPVYLTIFGLAHLWQLILAIDGAYHRNTIQIIGLSIFNALFLAWAALQISELKGIFRDTLDTNQNDESVADAIYDIPVTALTGASLGIIAFVEIGLVTLSWFVYKEMGWQIYHDLGADLRIKSYNFHYQIFVCILRFAAFFFAGFGIQFVWLVLYQVKDGEYWATMALLPISLLVLFWGAFAAHREHHVLMSGFMAALTGAGGYFVYKTIRIYQNKGSFQEVYKSLTIFSVLSIAITVLALIWSAIIMRNFGKGLKRQRERVALKKKEKRRERQRSQPNEPISEDAEIEMKRHRMSID